MKRFLSATAVAMSLCAAPVFAQNCGGDYEVKRGDSLSQIADRHYKDAGKWSSIHTANIGAVGENPNSIRIGMTLRLGCINGLPTGLPNGSATAVIEPAVVEPIPVAATAPSDPPLPLIKVVTADDFQPFTHRGLLNDGLMADVVNTALGSAVDEGAYDTFWVNDWSSHLEPMMSSHIMDMAFPWAKPDCDGNPEQARCVNFHFSDPMFEYLVLLFVNKASPIPFSQDSDMEGRTICRPNGYLTHMLDTNGRNWVAEEKITLVQPNSVNECFELLDAGDVEGVVLNEFTARTAIKQLEMKDRIDAVQTRPISITGLHVLIHKSNPNADALLSTVNRGLDQIKQSGQYQQIVDSHMSTIWANF